MENKMENKIYKVTVDCGDGEAREISGAGIIAIALTQGDDGDVDGQTNIVGMHSTNTIASAIKSMQKIFGAQWDRANTFVMMEQLADRMLGNNEQTEAPDEEQAEAEGNYGHV